MAVNTEELLDTIGNMTVLELSEFVDAFKDKFNVTAVAAPAAVAAGAEPEAAAEKDEFDVVLEGIGDKKIQVIKTVRSLTSLGLKEAKDLVESCPKSIKDGVTKEEAEKIKADIEAAGGAVTIE